MSYSLLIDGRKVQGLGRIDVVDPSTGSVFDSAPRADEALALQAIAASSNAGKSWAGLGYAGRRVYLHDFANAIESRTEELAAVLNRERAFGGPRSLEWACKTAFRVWKISPSDESLT